MLSVHRWHFSAWRRAVSLFGVHAIATWWDGIELWVTGVPFVPQALVVLLVVVPIAFGLAQVFDRVLAVVLRLLGRDARQERDADPVSNPSITEGL